MSGPHSLYHWCDDYLGTVAYIGPRCRIVVNRHGLGWDVQTTPKKAAPSGRRWTNRASLIRNRNGLSRIVLDHLSANYVAESGITQETVDQALEGLPEVFTNEWGRSIFALGKTVPTPAPSLSDVSPPTSYKTIYDIRAAWRAAEDA